MNESLKKILLTVAGSVLIGVLAWGAKAANAWRIADNNSRYVQQDAVRQQEINRLEERKSDLQYDLSHGRLDPETKGRKQNQLETVNSLLRQYGR